jgi:hypothetical protein
LYTGIILADFEVFVKNPPESVFALLLQLHDTKQNTFVQHKRMKTVRARTKIKFKTFALSTSTWVKTRVSSWLMERVSELRLSNRLRGSETVL